jgi:IS30 family transposase
VARIGAGKVAVLEGSGGDGGRPSGQAVVGLPVVVAGRGCGGSPVQGGDAGAVACDAAGALEGGGQPRTLPAVPARPRTEARRRIMVSGADREEISRGIAEGVEGVVIAARIGRNPSVVSREIARHGGRERYRATRAARVAASARCLPKARKLDADPVLRAQVIARLRAGHSPDQVAGRLRHEHSGQHAERVADTVSHEAIYTWIYALPKGELARQGILLRSGRTRRRPRGRSSSPGARIVGMTSIDARPAEASDRAVPGAWEGDLVIGKAGRSAMATLVERTSRYTVPVALPAGRRDALTTCDALIAAVSGMPSQLVKTLTWDQGSEMAGHAAFSLATAVDVYFAHPHSPWERGTNENTNGLLREYFPKGTEITDDQAYLDLVARELNNRPRRILGYRTPAEVFTDLLASSIASTG